ncbi:MAG: hypothetical protein OXH96_25875 [Spirochaetaceae bacterium]|nr:hypothetical protein [Spirochaetaceae bacterium]
MSGSGRRWCRRGWWTRRPARWRRATDCRGLDHNEYGGIAAGFALGCSLLTSRGVLCSGEGDLKNCQAMKIVDTSAPAIAIQR